jgi:hypothetical protein
MLRKNAAKLQNKIENKISELLDGKNAEVSLSLSNKFKIETDDCRYFFNRGEFDLVFFKSTDYVYLEDLENIKNKLEKYLYDNKKEINLLIWTYENITILED